MSNQVTIYDNKAMVEVADNYLTAEAKGISLPKNYDYKAAVSALYLQCVSLKTADGQAALEVCTPDSIKRTIQEMLTKGLNPSKKQCYPICYAVRDKDTKQVLYYELQLQSSYFGNKKQVYTNNPDVIPGSINAQCIYKGDVFEYKIIEGRKVVTKHEQKFENIIDSNIIGAYATVKFKDGSTMSDIMTIVEIKKSWAMSRSGGEVHGRFTHEMCCKTVESRLAKHLNNSTDDAANLEAADRQSETIYADEIDDADIPETTYSDVDEDGVIVGEAEPEAIEEEPVKTEIEKKCCVCGKALTDKVFKFSMDTYGKPLCMAHQKDEV